jgi:DNA primase
MSITKSSERWVDFSEIKQKITFEMILDHYGLTNTFKRKGPILTGVCPIHGSGLNPSQFKIDLSKGTGAWNCFGDCKEGGDMIVFVQRMEKASSLHKAGLIITKKMFPAIFDKNNEEPPIQKQAPTLPPEKPPLPVPIPPKSDSVPVTESLAIPNEKKASPIIPEKETKGLTFVLKTDPKHEYLKQRGLTAETIAYFHLGYAVKGLMRGRIAIPIHDEAGNLIGYCGRTVDPVTDTNPRYLFPANFPKGNVVFNLHRVIPLVKANPQLPIILVEGYFSCLWLHQNGFENTVAIMGSSLVEGQRERILKAHNSFFLLFDADPPGRECTIKTASDLIAAGAKKVTALNLPFASSEKFQPDHFSKEELAQFLY